MDSIDLVRRDSPVQASEMGTFPLSKTTLTNEIADTTDGQKSYLSWTQSWWKK